MKKVVTNPKIMLGKPTIEGTRITVEQILNLLSQKLTVEDILEDFPQLTKPDIQTAVKYAAKAVAHPKRQAIRYLHEIRR